MATQTFDPAKYKAAQRKDWSDAAAGWREWWKTIEEGLQPVSDRLVELGEIQPVQRVLDVATGIGEPAVTAARRVGPDGRLVATDIAPGMLEIGRERAAELGLTNIEFRERDAEELDLPEEEFDVVLCRFGLMFFPDLGAALRRMHRSLVRGGRLAAAVWGPPEKVPFASIALGVVTKELELPPPAPGTPGIFALADPVRLEGALREAGFGDVRHEPMTVTAEFASADEYTRFLQAVSAPINNLLADQSPERRAEIWRAVTQAIQQYAAADGSVSLPGEVICVVGRR